MGELFKTFGPWALVLLAMAWMLKVMVTDKLKNIMDTLEALVSGQRNHNDRIVRIETVMTMSGCMDADGCKMRRKSDEQLSITHLKE